MLEDLIFIMGKGGKIIIIGKVFRILIKFFFFVYEEEEIVVKYFYCDGCNFFL